MQDPKKLSTSFQNRPKLGHKLVPKSVKNGVHEALTTDRKGGQIERATVRDRGEAGDPLNP